LPRATKIVCTLGPATSSEETCYDLIQAGLDVARLNFSHGTHAEHGRRISTIRRLEEQVGRHVAILQDLGGPKVRTGKLLRDPLPLRPGEEVWLTSERPQGEREIPVGYPELIREVKAGQRLLLADGTIELAVEEQEPGRLRCTVVVGGELGSHKGINVPETTLATPSVTQKDIQDLRFGLRRGVDLIAISYVRGPEDVRQVRELMQAEGASLPLIAKIEKHEALSRIEEILAEVDGLMVARGDLGVEIPLEQVPHVQKELIAAANRAGKPVITATQMLRSMVDAPHPTRAEAADVANAIYDGTDALMLSEETAVGNYPVEATRQMCRIAEETERHLDYAALLQLKGNYKEPGRISDAVSHAACVMAQDLSASLIVTLTESGKTARVISRFRPRQPVLAVTPNRATAHALKLVWGVVPVLAKLSKERFDFASLKRIVLDSGLVRRGQRVVLAGVSDPKARRASNLVKVEEL
jgi:pyruvate kinase